MTVETIGAIADQIRAESTEPLAAQAWRQVAAAVRGLGAKWTRQIVGYGHSHYADPNASGGNGGYRYSERVGVVIGNQTAAVCRGGGQNSGHHYWDADKDDCLFFSLDGKIYQPCGVHGSWSQWQGSSTSYDLEWRRYDGEISDEVLSEVVARVVRRLTDRRDTLRRRKQAGAATASRIIEALAGL